MMYEFLANNRDDLIARCRAKVARRPKRAATKLQLQNGIPMFLDQLTRTLEAEQAQDTDDSLKISGPSGGDTEALSEMGVSATAHGRELLTLGFSVDQVVHDYGDLCQAITDLAFERDAPFAIDEFRTLNRCLDNAIADAVTEFSFQRDGEALDKHFAEENERLGTLMHELRNLLGTASLAVSALEAGNLTMVGATGTVLKRSLVGLENLISRTLSDVRNSAGLPIRHTIYSLAAFISDIRESAGLEAHARGCPFIVTEVDASLGFDADRDLLFSALTNLLQNAFKFTHSHTEVTLSAYGQADRILIDVGDNCGGLPAGDIDTMFKPFTQHGEDRSGLGLGLAIARQSVEADRGTLTVRDVPGTGCVFTISLPRFIVR
jgi:signal transduction histidine kinase